MYKRVENIPWRCRIPDVHHNIDKNISLLCCLIYMYSILLPIRRALSQTALGREGGGVYIISLSTDSYSKGHTNICIKDSAGGWEGGGLLHPRPFID